MNDSWTKKAAIELAKSSSECTLTAGMVETLLEAAGELKCVELKVALGRCYELLANKRGVPDDGFLENLLELLK